MWTYNTAAFGHCSTPWNATLRHVKIFIASVKPYGLKNQDNVALDGSNPNLKKAIYMVKYRIIIQMAIGKAHPTLCVNPKILLHSNDLPL